MSTTAMEKETTRAVARPLGALVPLIKKAMEAEQRASMEQRRDVGTLLLEAQQRMKDDGTFYAKKGPGSGRGGSPHSGAWGKWLEKNFTLSIETASRYMRLGALSASTAATYRSLNEMRRDQSTRLGVANNLDGRRSRTQKLVDYLTEGGAERLEQFVTANERERRRREVEEKAVEQVMAEAVKAGAAACLRRYHPDHGGTAETFQVARRAQKRLGLELSTAGEKAIRAVVRAERKHAAAAGPNPNVVAEVWTAVETLAKNVSGSGTLAGVPVPVDAFVRLLQDRDGGVVVDLVLKVEAVAQWLTALHAKIEPLATSCDDPNDDPKERET